MLHGWSNIMFFLKNGTKCPIYTRVITVHCCILHKKSFNSNHLASSPIGFDDLETAKCDKIHFSDSQKQFSAGLFHIFWARRQGPV